MHGRKLLVDSESVAELKCNPCMKQNFYNHFRFITTLNGNFDEIRVHPINLTI